MYYNKLFASVTDKFEFLLATFANRPYKGRVTDENLFSIQVSNYLKEVTLAGRCPYVWFHVANEGVSSTTRKILMQGCLRRNMGKMPGVADFVFLGANKSFCLELKVNKRKLSPSQKIFQEWCDTVNVGFAIAYTIEEVIDILKREKIILPD